MKLLKLFVCKYEETSHSHICEVLNDGYAFSDETFWRKGEKIRVDLLVSGDLPGHQDLVGKTVSTDCLFPYISIANNVKIVEGDKNETT